MADAPVSSSTHTRKVQILVWSGTASITVNVPLVGGRVEKEAVARVGHAFDREHQLAAEWAAKQG